MLKRLTIREHQSGAKYKERKETEEKTERRE
jgi:hypothetical protein